VAALVLPGSAAVAEEEGAGGSTGDHGGSGGHDTESTGSLYADLVIAYRAADGTPVLKEFYTPATSEDPAASDFCVQPASFARVPGVQAQVDPITGKQVYVLPLQGEWIGSTEPLPVEEIEPCDVQPQYAMFVAEAELERLNLGRTSDDVLQRKLEDVQTKFALAETLSLDPAGRIAADGAALDASPEYAAMYASLMRTGTIPGLKEDGVVSQAAHGDEYAGFEYDAYDLAAVALGTAASKSVPITVDTVQYYNRVVGFTAAAPGWDGITFLQSADPVGDPDASIPRNVRPGSENFVNYSDFTYNRADTFPGSVTWLDVPTLTWQVSPILDEVAFTEVAAPEKWSDGTLTGLAGFAQMADDVRAVINYLHENEVIPGFFMDPVGVDTTDEQSQRLTSPAADLVLPTGPVFETRTFPFSVSLFNPRLGDPIETARLRLTITPASGSDPLGVEDVTLTSGADPVELTMAGGSLVGWWDLDTGIDDTAATGFSATFADGTAGSYNVASDLFAGGSDGTGTSLATDTESLTVLDDVPTVLWAGDVPTVATQGAQIPLPLSVYTPTAALPDAPAELRLTVSVDDPSTPGADALTTNSVRVYGEQGDVMVAMPFTASDGTLTGTWTTPLDAGDNPVTWYLSVVEGAPVGQYTLDVTLVDGADAAGMVQIGISAPVDHKSPNAPVIEKPEVSGDSVTITASSSDGDVDHYDFVLVSDFVHLDKVSSGDGTVTFDGLAAGTYKVNVTAIDKAGNVSGQSATTFVIAAGSTPPPVTPTDPPPASGGGDPTVPPTDPGDGDGDGPGGPPETFIGNGPPDRAFVLGHSVTYRLRSDGENVRYRVVLNNRVDQDCDGNVCVVEGLRAGKNVLRFAAEADGERDRTPVVRTVYVPRSAAGLTMTERWKVSRNARAFDGRLVWTEQRGQVIRTRARDLERIALVVATDKGNGRVQVYLGQRLLTSTPIGLASRTNRHQVLVPVATFRKLQTGVVRVEVVSRGKPVRIEGIGIVTR
jgi:hypothetical protein